MNILQSIFDPIDRINFFMRTAYYLVLTLIVLGLNLCGLVFLSALSPEPGANLRLMGVPLIGLPVTILGAGLLFIAHSAHDLSLLERRIALTVSALTVVPFAVLVVLG